MITYRSHHGREREMNHIATGRARSPGENYSLLIMGDNNVDGDGGGVDGDGSGAIPHPGRVPQNWSSMVAALQNFSSTEAD
jgi:hypothetical protein